MKKQNVPTDARKKAMDYLARREHGRVELLKKLTAFGFVRDVSEDAITLLIEDGLQSDQRFVDAFVRSRISQGKGPAKIRAELGEHGVDDGLIDGGLFDAEPDWYALAREVKVKKFGPDVARDFKGKARQMRFLQSRGFEADHIQSAVSADPD